MTRLTEFGLLDSSPTGPFLHPLLAEFARLQDAASPTTSLPSLVDALGSASRKTATSALFLAICRSYLTCARQLSIASNLFLKRPL